MVPATRLSGTMSSVNFQGRTTPPPSQDRPLPSTSNGAPREGVSTRKQRRNPSVTPRKFNRFFTPRSLRSSDASSSRNALHEIDGPANGQDITQSSPIQPARVILGRENTPAVFPRDLKRRKLYHTPESSPEYFEVDGKRQEVGFRVPQVESSEEHENIPSSPCERASRDLRGIPEELSLQEPLEPIVQIEDRGIGAQLLQQRINAAPTARRQYLSYPVNG